MTNFACPCCMQLVYSSPPRGEYWICPVCGWEDDPVQAEDPNFRGGSNKLSLVEARLAWEAQQEKGSDLH